jgi:membrane protease YdiL (CAAX protease family)
MLFWAKKTTARGLLTLLVLVAVTYGLSIAAGVSPTSRLGPLALRLGVVAWLVILASDFVIHTALTWLGGDRYRKFGVEFQGYFDGMTPAACLVGGLVAGLGEEPLFRGVLLPLFSAPSPAVGLLVTALLFGAAHFIRPSLRLLAVWAAWQGVLLGSAFLLTGSLAAVMLAHFLHDTTAFLAITTSRNRSGDAK